MSVSSVTNLFLIFFLRITYLNAFRLSTSLFREIFPWQGHNLELSEKTRTECQMSWPYSKAEIRESERERGLKLRIKVSNAVPASLAAPWLTRSERRDWGRRAFFPVRKTRRGNWASDPFGWWWLLLSRPFWNHSTRTQASPRSIHTPHCYNSLHRLTHTHTHNTTFNRIIIITSHTVLEIFHTSSRILRSVWSVLRVVLGVWDFFFNPHILSRGQCYKPRWGRESRFRIGNRVCWGEHLRALLLF